MPRLGTSVESDDPSRPPFGAGHPEFEGVFFPGIHHPRIILWMLGVGRNFSPPVPRQQPPDHRGLHRVADPLRQGRANRRKNQQARSPRLFSPRLQKIDLLLGSLSSDFRRPPQFLRSEEDVRPTWRRICIRLTDAVPTPSRFAVSWRVRPTLAGRRTASADLKSSRLRVAFTVRVALATSLTSI